MTPIRTGFRGLRAATVLLTRFPIGGFPFTRDEWRWASAAYPVVGAGIGVLLSGVWWIARPLGPLSSALVVYMVSLLITGALHEDGLADSADALGGATTRDTLFAILKDSRAGTYGVLALVLSLGLRCTLLARLDSAVAAGLVLSQSLARLGPVYLMAALPYVTPDGSRSSGVVHTGPAQVLLASAIGLAALAVCMVISGVTIREGLGIVVGLAIVTAGCGRLFSRRAGGITGDFLGATEQLGEVVVLAAMAFT